MELISRKDARIKGLKRYFTGKECKNGHLAERYVSSSSETGVCVECNRGSSCKWAKDNKRLHNNRNREYVEINPEKCMLATAKHRSKKEGFEFDLEIEDIIIPDICPV